MINLFKLKRYAALLVMGCLPTISFYIGIVYYGLWVALACFLVALLVGVFTTSIIMRNPFTMMLEGKGLLCFNIDSTGIIRPFIVALNQPYVIGKLGNDNVNDVYDREAVVSLAQPVQNGNAVMEEGEITIKMDENVFNKSRMGMYHYPVLIYNSQIKSCITKDFLSESEKQSFAEHGVLYLNRKLEELTTVVRDFGRYVVELTKPKESIWQNKWVRIVIIVLIIALIALFAKPVWNTLMSTGGAAAKSLNNQPVIPR